MMHLVPGKYQEGELSVVHKLLSLWVDSKLHVQIAEKH
jgi:hypothetical protein